MAAHCPRWLPARACTRPEVCAPLPVVGEHTGAHWASGYRRRPNRIVEAATLAADVAEPVRGKPQRLSQVRLAQHMVRLSVRRPDNHAIVQRTGQQHRGRRRERRLCLRSERRTPAHVHDGVIVPEQQSVERHGAPDMRQLDIVLLGSNAVFLAHQIGGHRLECVACAAGAGACRARLDANLPEPHRIVLCAGSQSHFEMRWVGAHDGKVECADPVLVALQREPMREILRAAFAHVQVDTLVCESDGEQHARLSAIRRSGDAHERRI